MAEEGAPAASYQNSQPVSGKATAADPSYTEGAIHRLSLTLAGYLRTVVAAGSSIIGKVGIDQTTPGVTNGVVASNAQITTASVVVSSGQSLSAAVDLGAAMLCGIQTPSNIDGATSLTFQVTYDGVTYTNFYDNTDTEYTLPTGTSRAQILPYQDFVGVRGIKLRLGTSGSPVTATADRTFTVGKRP